MRPELIVRIENLIAGLNSKQQNIARGLFVNSNISFFETTISNNTEIFLQEKSTGNIYHFLTWIKKTCNCD